jgi:hypothetical protein
MRFVGFQPIAEDDCAAGSEHLRFEVSPGSALPAKLAEFGYSVRHAGTGTRLSPGNTPEEIFRTVDIVEITLPGK